MDDGVKNQMVIHAMDVDDEGEDADHVHVQQHDGSELLDADSFYHSGMLPVNIPTKKHGHATISMEDMDKPLSMLSALRTCRRRQRHVDHLSPFSNLMTWTLSKAAHVFATGLLCRSHVPKSAATFASSQQPASLDLCHDGARGSAKEEEDGLGEVRESLGQGGHCLPDDHHSPADGVGLLAREGERSGDLRGNGLKAQGSEEVDDLESGKERMDPTGHRPANREIQDTFFLGEGAREVPACRRVLKVSFQPIPEVVDLPDLRVPLGTTGSVPETPQARSLKTVVGTYPKFLPAPKLRPEQGSIELQVNHRGRVGMVSGKTGSTSSAATKLHTHTKVTAGKVFVQGEANDRPPSLPTSKENFRSGELQPGRRERATGARHRQVVGRDLGPGDGEPQQPGGGQRVLAHQDQLDGRLGKALRSMMRSRFSKFMVFLCMNCCLPTATTTAFGSPDCVASYSSELNEFKFLDPHEVQSGDDYVSTTVTCCVYGHLAQHFASAQTDAFGTYKPLNKEQKRWFKNEFKKLKKPPKVIEATPRSE